MRTTNTLLAILIAIFFSQVNLSTVFGQPLTEAQLELVKQFEQDRVEAINRVIDSVIAIYDSDRQGGGSGVIIDPSGIALTNHHVIMGSGVEGWGGLADGKLYRWELIGTDPGGDVSIIQMHGRTDFPHTPLGDSELVRVGDWALAMGNPFVLTEDQKPTVTLGIVSGVKRYQYGAGKNQLVYGNCIQVDSSINPGNSGGPLFNMAGEVIGINGRGSFQDRGRVNVGLGYAISSNQIKNFIPDLLATKLVEHGTLDANFSDRSGKVVCSSINEFSPAFKLGLRLEDELLEFEGFKIDNANQFTNLICTLPESWPASLLVRSKENELKSIHTRLIGLPYAKPRGEKQRPEKDDAPEQRKAKKRQAEMIDLLSAPPGTVRKKELNSHYARLLLDSWGNDGQQRIANESAIKIDDHVFDREGKQIGSQTIWLVADGRFIVRRKINGAEVRFSFDGENFVRSKDGDEKTLTRTEAKLSLPIVEAMGVLSVASQSHFRQFGRIMLDGGDKAANSIAFRFKTIDDEDDWFYFWHKMYDNQGKRIRELVKAGADLDSDSSSGSIIFEDWVTHEGWRIPASRRHIIALEEQTQSVSKLVSVTPVSTDDLTSIFRP